MVCTVLGKRCLNPRSLFTFIEFSVYLLASQRWWVWGYVGEISGSHFSFKQNVHSYQFCMVNPSAVSRTTLWEWCTAYLTCLFPSLMLLTSCFPFLLFIDISSSIYKSQEFIQTITQSYYLPHTPGLTFLSATCFTYIDCSFPSPAVQFLPPDLYLPVPYPALYHLRWPFWASFPSSQTTDLFSRTMVGYRRGEGKVRVLSSLWLVWCLRQCHHCLLGLLWSPPVPGGPGPWDLQTLPLCLVLPASGIVSSCAANLYLHLWFGFSGVLLPV